MESWPSHFPKQCPPANARQDNILVYRLVDSVPPTLSDFSSTVKAQPGRNFSPDEICCACGVSVFQNLQDLINKKSRFKPLRNKKIVVGHITHLDGLVLETFTPSHITWWLQTDEPHRNFTEYKENDAS